MTHDHPNPLTIPVVYSSQNGQGDWQGEDMSVAISMSYKRVVVTYVAREGGI